MEESPSLLEGIDELIGCPDCKCGVSFEPRLGARCVTCGSQYQITEEGQLDLRPRKLHDAHELLPSDGILPRPRTGIIRGRLRGIGNRILEAIYSRGNNVECCFCGWTGFRFLPAGRHRTPNRRCPSCGSIERYRAAKLLLQDEVKSRGRDIRLLEIAPTSYFRDYCIKQNGLRYVSSDLNSPHAAVLSDLTKMGFASDAVDIILCLHVMEHIADDLSAYSEMYRILKSSGVALVMVPLHGESTFEEHAAKAEDRERLFGQFDHVRKYGMDIVDRIESVGFNVKTIMIHEYFAPDQFYRFGLGGDDRYMFRAYKQ